MEHLYRLLPHCAGGFFEVQALRNRHLKHIDSLGRSPGHQGLEGAGRVHAGGLCHMNAVLSGVVWSLPTVVEVGRIWDLLLIQNPHHVGLLFLVLCHISHLKIYTPARTHTMPPAVVSPMGSPNTATPVRAATTGSRLAIMLARPASTWLSPRVYSR